ncbi:citrate synthase [Rubricella aquisinus]|uniref:Citrate synthase n=1 Tax=Rubricella aquisinus TaxID=2028108 RepID=A0A840WVJ5_9RHOB|nr:citrate synthase [Rubricella aquisinus]MBB5514264.1 citrate synthase [Rubricella aquisinus]
MKSDDWIDGAAACALLGVKAQTLYAYVSRKQIRVLADPADARRSLYARTDVIALQRSNRRPRARAAVAEQAIRWGDPVLSTAISELRNGVVWVRGRSILSCAQDMTLEEVAAHLWQVESVTSPAVTPPQRAARPLARAMTYLSGEVSDARPLAALPSAAVARIGGTLMSGVANALLGQAAGGPIHERFAQTWGVNAQEAEALRRALVLLSDHELNPSTFAVRVAASTGASLPAALLSGMATLSGPRHGGAGHLAQRAIRAELSGATDRFLAEHAADPPYAFGFGHPLYPDGDPRAVDLRAALPAAHPAHLALARLSALLGIPANIDGALAVLGLTFDLPEDAAFILFATGRLAGWIAHAREQAQSGEIIRPRARYAAP